MLSPWMVPIFVVRSFFHFFFVSSPLFFWHFFSGRAFCLFAINHFLSKSPVSPPRFNLSFLPFRGFCHDLFPTFSISPFATSPLFGPNCPRGPGAVPSTSVVWFFFFF